MEASRKATLTKGPVKPLLFRMTVPMMLGMLGLIAFNIVDTYFVSRLGTDELAALTFTFPVVLIINSLSLGIGTGTLSVMARAIGEGDRSGIVRYATDSLVLGVLVAGVFVLLGLATIDPLFRFLGAGEAVLVHIRAYMRIWYIGVVFVVVPMVGNNSIRALGDTKTPGLVMLVAALANTALDPLLIFGPGPFPALGVAGAALATVFSRMTTFSVALHVLARRERILSFKGASLGRILGSWKAILFVGLPNALTRVVQPVGIGIITGILASGGVEAVAGFGVAAKLERFALIPVMALAVVMAPFTGQNFGAGRCDRVEEGMRISYGFSMGAMLALYGVLALAAPGLAALFTKDPAVASVMILYLRLAPLGYGAYGVLQISVSIMNALSKPIQAALSMAAQLFVFYVPMAFAGLRLFGPAGVFGALVLANALAAAGSRALARGFVGKGRRPGVCALEPKKPNN